MSPIKASFEGPGFRDEFHFGKFSGLSIFVVRADDAELNIVEGVAKSVEMFGNRER